MPLRIACRRHIAALVAGFSLGASLALMPAPASAEPCDGQSCVTHLKTDAVAGAQCSAARLYAFGVDGSGRTFICYATYRSPKTSTWVPVPPLLGVRDYGALCDGKGVAQSFDGIPMVCRDGIWDKYTPALPVS